MFSILFKILYMVALLFASTISFFVHNQSLELIVLWSAILFNSIAGMLEED